MTPSEAPEALQASECNELLDDVWMKHSSPSCPLVEWLVGWLASPRCISLLLSLSLSLSLSPALSFSLSLSLSGVDCSVHVGPQTSREKSTLRVLNLCCARANDLVGCSDTPIRRNLFADDGMQKATDGLFWELNPGPLAP